MKTKQSAHTRTHTVLAVAFLGISIALAAGASLQARNNFFITANTSASSTPSNPYGYTTSTPAISNTCTNKVTKFDSSKFPTSLALVGTKKIPIQTWVFQAGPGTTSAKLTFFAASKIPNEPLLTGLPFYNFSIDVNGVQTATTYTAVPNSDKTFWYIPFAPFEINPSGGGYKVTLYADVLNWDSLSPGMLGKTIAFNIINDSCYEAYAKGKYQPVVTDGKLAFIVKTGASLTATKAIPTIEWSNDIGKIAPTFGKPDYNQVIAILKMTGQTPVGLNNDFILKSLKLKISSTSVLNAGLLKNSSKFLLNENGDSIGHLLGTKDMTWADAQKNGIGFDPIQSVNASGFTKYLYVMADTAWVNSGTKICLSIDPNYSWSDGSATFASGAKASKDVKCLLY